MPKTILKIHYDILDPERQEVWLKLKEFKGQGILGGGTALALQLRHRLSFDFDIFFKKPIAKKLLSRVNKIFGASNIHPLVNNEDELTVLYKNKIKITFLYFPFKKLSSTIKTNSIDLFNLKDLAAYKAYTIGRRGTYRDYLDIYILLIQKFNLEQIIKIARQIFKSNFNEKLFLEQLVYFDDLKDFKIEFIDPQDKKHMPKIVKEYFTQQIKKYLQK
ncbi:MAG: nucleotidyl transferase AbiEii/AbiGii toxin family protein [Patescibacteria group bacterium]